MLGFLGEWEGDGRGEEGGEWDMLGVGGFLGGGVRREFWGV